MLDIRTYSEGLCKKDGIYFSKKIKKSVISYPEEGHNRCLKIEDNSFWFRHRNSCIILGIKRYYANKIIFDVGGGNGFVSKALQDENITSVLVEPGIQGCLNARKRNISVIICSSLQDAGFKFNSIPAIGMFDVLEHIENDIQYCKDLHDVLIKDGLLFLTVPTYRFLWSDADVSAGHFRRYTKKDLVSKLNSVGFKVEYATYFFSILPIAIFLFRTIPYKFVKNRQSGNIEHRNNEHNTRKGLLGKILNRIWKMELSKFQKGKTIPFGASLFIVAKKV